MPENRIVHITLERCGSQWVKNLLTRREVLAGSGLTYSKVTGSIACVEHLNLPSHTFAGPIYNMNQWEWRSWRKAGDKAIVVLRDPRDIIVSLMFAWLYSHSLDANVQVVRRILSLLPVEDDRLAYVMGAIGQSHRMIWSWTAAELDGTALLTHYENLVANPLEGFGKMLEWLEWKVRPDVLRAAVNALSFESQVGRPRGVEEVFSHYRRGQPGDWRNHFTREHGRLWEAMYPGLLRASGYEKADDWWQSLPDVIGRESKMPCDHVTVVTETLHRRNAHLEREVEQKEVVIRELASACDARLAVIHEKEQMIRELAEACDARLAVIREKEQMIQELADACEARLAVIKASGRALGELEPVRQLLELGAGGEDGIITFGCGASHGP